MFKERLNMIYSEIKPYKRISIIFLSVIVLTFLLAKVATFFPSVEKVLTYASISIFYLFTGSIILLMLLACLYEVWKFIKWLFVEPYQNYKKQ